MVSPVRGRKVCGDKATNMAKCKCNKALDVRVVLLYTSQCLKIEFAKNKARYLLAPGR
jgi:hypothetical protein